jgi:Ni/Fe-hydrogenase b-type cytochrome subunit
LNEVSPSAALSPQVEPIAQQPQGGELVHRHGLVTRIWHWINAVTVIVMFMSGLMILNAHPRLYWGDYGHERDDAWLILGGIGQENFPGWLTIPSTYSLADARLWHLAFALVLAGGLAVYLAWGLLSRRWLHSYKLTWSDLLPGHLWAEIREHALLRFPTGAAALHYNTLQKLAYAGTLFVLLPLVILTGMMLSPGLNAAMPWLEVLLGGRQSARSIHFLAASGLVLFFIVHIAMVILAGPFNELRSMISGWYRLPKDPEGGAS